jgi:hypothetical protein
MRARIQVGYTLAALLAAASLLAQEPAAAVRQIKVQPDQAPDCTSLKAIAESVTRGLTNNDAKGVAVYNFMQLTHYHFKLRFPGDVSVLQEINCYGWSLCGHLHAESSAIWRELGWKWRFVGWDGHTTVEAGYDDRWHYFDSFLKFYAWMPDGKGGRTIAGEEDLRDNADKLVRDAFVLDTDRRCVYAKDNQFIMNGDHANWRAPDFLTCGDTISGVIGGLRTLKVGGPSPGWMGVNHATGDYSTDVNLVPGSSIENNWDAQPDCWYCQECSAKGPAHTCAAHKDTRNDPGFGLVLEPYIKEKPARSYANGTLRIAPDFGSDAVLKGFAAVDNVKVANGTLVPAEAGKPASVTVRLASPYILIRASAEAAGADALEVSVDNGKTFKAADLKDFGAAVKGKCVALLRIGFKEALKSLQVSATFQNNAGSLPFLSPGRNKVTVSVADPAALGENKLVVTYAYRLGARSQSFDQLCESGREIARQNAAAWSDSVTVAQKTFTARDLPATFEIDCPTPKGKYPVYPRMLFLRREVIGPAGKPQALPEGAVAAVPAPAEELPSLPNPLLIGTEPPEPIKPRATKATRIPLQYVQYVNETGVVTNYGILRWPKNDGEKGKVLCSAVLLAADLKDLPPRKVAAARLVVPVERAFERVPTKLGVVLLKSAPEAGKPCNVPALGEPAETIILPKQPADMPLYSPPKPYAFDLTRAMRAVASGDKACGGFALRIVPDRAVDDGHTVRCNISPTNAVYLEADIYTD